MLKPTRIVRKRSFLFFSLAVAVGSFACGSKPLPPAGPPPPSTTTPPAISEPAADPVTAAETTAEWPGDIAEAARAIEAREGFAPTLLGTQWVRGGVGERGYALYRAPAYAVCKAREGAECDEPYEVYDNAFPGCFDFELALLEQKADGALVVSAPPKKFERIGAEQDFPCTADVSFEVADFDADGILEIAVGMRWLDSQIPQADYDPDHPDDDAPDLPTAEAAGVPTMQGKYLWVLHGDLSLQLGHELELVCLDVETEASRGNATVGEHSFRDVNEDGHPDIVWRRQVGPEPGMILYCTRDEDGWWRPEPMEERSEPEIDGCFTSIEDVVLRYLPGQDTWLLP